MSVDGTNFGINIDQEFQSDIAGQGSYGDGNWLSHYPTDQVQGDLNDLWNVGFRRVRVAAGDLSSPMAGFRDDRFATHLHSCDLAFQRGFHVEYGAPPKNALKPSEWKFWLDNILSYTQQFQDLLTLHGGSGVWMIGNENETNNNLAASTSRDAITSMTRVSNLITVVMPDTHSMQTGDKIRYYNASSGNGSGSTLEVTSNTTKTITLVDANTFTFASTGSDGSSTTGWIQYDASTVINQMKRTATVLKAAGITVPLSYSCVQGTDFNAQLNIKSFGLLGRGDLDFVDLNIYGVPSDQAQRFAEFITEVDEGILRFGTDHLRITEWHVGTNNSLVPTNIDTATYWLLQRLSYIQAKGLKHYHFCYRQGSNLLILKKPYNTYEGTYRDWWWRLVGKRQQTKEIVFGTPIQISAVRTGIHPRTIPWTGVCMNYGQDTQDGTYNTSVINKDLDEMWDQGITRLRIAASNYEFTAGVDTSKTLALAAKAKGFHVIWGVSFPSNITLTDATWAAYATAVNDAADWATTNGIDEFQIGNEIEYSETTDQVLTSSVSKIKTMATDVKTNHFTGTISYAMAQSSMEYTGAPSGWIATGKGDIDLLGYNVYADDGLTVAQGRTQLETRTSDLYTAFGSSLYISEWNLGIGTLFPSTTAEKAAILQTRLDFFRALGIQYTYFFTYRWDSGTASNQLYFPIKSGVLFREWFYPILNLITL